MSIGIIGIKPGDEAAATGSVASAGQAESRAVRDEDLDFPERSRGATGQLIAPVTARARDGADQQAVQVALRVLHATLGTRRTD
jgi:hypothetical protein